MWSIYNDEADWLFNRAVEWGDQWPFSVDLGWGVNSVDQEKNCLAFGESQD